MEAIFDTVFYPEESLATVIAGSRLVYLPYSELTRFRNKYGNQYDHRLYVTGVRDIVEWSALSEQQVAWVASDLAFSYACKSVALVSTRQLALDSDRYRMVYEPLAEDCSCYTCQQFTCAYLHHLLKQTPLLAIKLVAIHNLTDMIYHS